MIPEAYTVLRITYGALDVPLKERNEVVLDNLCG